MSILKKAVEIAATLDPSLGLELEQEFGSSWESLLGAEIERANNAEPTIRETIRDNDPDTARKMLAMADVRALAEEMKIETRGKNELTLITEIKDAL